MAFRSRVDELLVDDGVAAAAAAAGTGKVEAPEAVTGVPFELLFQLDEPKAFMSTVVPLALLVVTPGATVTTAWAG